MADGWIAAGFFVTKSVVGDDERSAHLLPPRFVSLAGCSLVSGYQVYWGWDVEQHRAASVAFGIPETRLEDLHTWEKSHGISFPNVFHSVDDARDFVREFLPTPDDVIVLGAALPDSLVREFLVDHKQRCYYPETETWSDMCDGINLVLTAGQPLPGGGEPLGFDMIQYADGQLCCSWICTGAERAVHAALGVRPNAHGLIDGPEEALRVDAWLQEHPEVLEPDGAFYPWQLVRYR